MGGDFFQAPRALLRVAPGHVARLFTVYQKIS